MTTEKKKMEIVFAPGCFDNFEGTQEELDQFIQEIQTMFTELTPEELAERSTPVNLDEIDDDTLEQIAEGLGLLEDDEAQISTKKLH